MYNKCVKKKFNSNFITDYHMKNMNLKNISMV
jgi:hypothetical protein